MKIRPSELKKLNFLFFQFTYKFVIVKDIISVTLAFADTIHFKAHKQPISSSQVWFMKPRTEQLKEKLKTVKRKRVKSLQDLRIPRNNLSKNTKL